MSIWTVEDEINLHKWINEKGFKLVYLPQQKEWGFYHNDKSTEINGGFPNISDLKQYFVNLKGDKKNVRIVSEGDFHQEMEKIRSLSKLR